MSDREQFEAARAAGLKARHETRVERANEREAYERGRKEALTELRDWLYSHQHKRIPLAKWSAFLDIAAHIAREIGSKETS